MVTLPWYLSKYNALSSNQLDMSSYPSVIIHQTHVPYLKHILRKTSEASEVKLRNFLIISEAWLVNRPVNTGDRRLIYCERAFDKNVRTVAIHDKLMNIHQYYINIIQSSIVTLKMGNYSFRQKKNYCTRLAKLFKGWIISHIEWKTAWYLFYYTKM